MYVWQPQYPWASPSSPWGLWKDVLGIDSPNLYIHTAEMDPDSVRGSHVTSPTLTSQLSLLLKVMSGHWLHFNPIDLVHQKGRRKQLVTCEELSTHCPAEVATAVILRISCMSLQPCLELYRSPGSRTVSFPHQVYAMQLSSLNTLPGPLFLSMMPSALL